MLLSSLKDNKYLILLIYLLCSPFQFITIGGIGIVRLINALVLMIFLIVILKMNKKIIIDSRTKYLILLYTYLCFTCIWCIDSLRALNTIIMYTLIVFNYLFISQFKFNKINEKFFYFSFNIISTIISIFLIFEINTYNLAGRITLNYNGINADPNFLGINIVFSIICNIYLLISTKIKGSIKLFLIILLIFQVAGIIKLASRGTFITLSISLMILILPYVKRKPRLIIIIPIITVFSLFLLGDVIASLPENVIERLNMIEAFKGGANGRFEIWIKALNLTFKDPFYFLFGHGAGQMPIYLEYAHNFFIELLFEYGILGLLIILIFFIKVLFRDVRKNCFKMSLLALVIVSSLSLSTDRCVLIWNILILFKMIN